MRKWMVYAWRRWHCRFIKSCARIVVNNEILSSCLKFSVVFDSLQVFAHFFSMLMALLKAERLQCLIDTI